MITGLLLKGDSAKVVTYTVHEPPHPPADRVDRAQEVLFVKDGFSWGAFLIPPLWLAANRIWLALAAYLGVVTLLTGGMAMLEVPADRALLVFLGLNLILGFEGENLKRLMLERKGWASLGTVSGRNIGECERRFFEHWLPGQPVIAFERTARPAPMPSPPAPTQADAAPAPAAAASAPVAPAGWRQRLGRTLRS